jgi:2-keto-4-pentenoate hydratase
LSLSELGEVVETIAQGRLQHRSVELPDRLRTRDWTSVIDIILALDERLGREAVGWKVGAASEEVRRAEGLPSASPGRIYGGTVFPSGIVIGPELFINYRNIECEFAFQLGLDFPVRDRPYDETDIRSAIEVLFPVLELGDSVFPDWYGAASYFGSTIDNGGSAALIEGDRTASWQELELPVASMDLYLNGFYIKSGVGRAAMGHPITSLTWMVNWAISHGRSVAAGEIISTGTCTGHCFAARGDTASADFGSLGWVDVTFG